MPRTHAASPRAKSNVNPVHIACKIRVRFNVISLLVVHVERKEGGGERRRVVDVMIARHTPSPPPARHTHIILVHLLTLKVSLGSFSLMYCMASGVTVVPLRSICLRLSHQSASARAPVSLTCVFLSSILRNCSQRASAWTPLSVTCTQSFRFTRVIRTEHEFTSASTPTSVTCVLES